jgi:hypothetical protein
MATPTEQIQQLYLSYYNRPGDVAGVNFWVNSLNAGTSLATISKEFAKAPEYTATYGGKTPDAVIATIYQNLFNRLPESGGLNYWSDLLSRKVLTIDNIVESIAASATQDATKGPDYVAVSSKVAAAIAFTDYLNTDVAARVAYSTGSSNAVATAYLAGVTNDATLTTAKAGLATTAGAIIDGSSGVGSTYNSNISVDTFAGTAGNDTINILSINPTTGAATSTLGSFDSFTGGAGKDVANIYSDAGINNAQVGTFAGIETINIYNASATAADQFGAGTVDASKFVGATAVWQLGNAGAVTGLAATTTAGFNGTKDVVVDVTATGATANVALKDVAGAAVGNAITLSAAGTKLTGLNISGNIVKNDTSSKAAAAAVVATAVVAEDATTFTLNTAVNTELVLDDSGSTDEVTTLAAGASTGAVKFVGDAAVTSITTGSGKDTVTLASGLTATIKSASVSTGAGNDNITVTAASAVAGGAVTVDGGAGNDKISVTFDANVKYTIAGGAGDDTVVITSGNAAEADVVDGGDGTDTIAMASKLTAYVAGDYLVYTKVLKNFEGIEFTTALTGTAAFDASQVAAIKNFTLDAGGTIAGVLADQNVTTSDNLTVTAAGYTAAGATAAHSGTVYSTTALTGALKVFVDTDAKTVTANANSVALTVDAIDGDVGTTLTGDVKTASVALNNTEDGVASLSIAVATTTTGADATKGASTALGELTSLTLTGDGSAIVTNTGGTFSTKLTTIDASGLNSVDVDGKVADGLTFTSANTAAETVKLGGGLDHITLTSSTYGATGANKIDTVTGLNLVLDATGTALDAAKSDTLVINGGLSAVKWTTTATDLDVAILSAIAADVADAAHDAVVFTFGGNTYVVSDAATGTVGSLDAGDTVVRLTGTGYNLDTLVIAL